MPIRLAVFGEPAFEDAPHRRSIPVIRHCLVTALREGAQCSLSRQPGPRQRSRLQKSPARKFSHDHLLKITAISYSEFRRGKALPERSSDPCPISSAALLCILGADGKREHEAHPIAT